MKILQLCKKFPFPLKDGESIAVTNLSKSLQQGGCEISLLAMNTRKHYFDLDDIPGDLHFYQDIQAVDLDNRIKPWKAFLNLFSRDSYHISRFVCQKFRNRLVSLLKANEYDIVQLETLYLAPYIKDIRRHSNAVIALRAHNVEHEIWERITLNTPSLLKKWYLSHLTNKLRRYEIESLKDYDLLIPISEKDEEAFRKFGFRQTSIVTPIGLDLEEYPADYSSFRRPISVSFIGSLDWMPNREGLDWFLSKVWQRLTPEFPDLELHVAGRNTPASLYKKRSKNVVIHGEVPNAVDFINQHSIMVVPLLSGSGMRAKILEGMALGKVVMTTQLGLEGIRAKIIRKSLLRIRRKPLLNPCANA